MCEHCVIRGRKAWAELALPEETKRIIRQAITDEVKGDEFERGEASGEHREESYRREAYKRKVVPVREALIAAANDAKRRADAIRTNNEIDAMPILDDLIENILRDADRIPISLPST